MGKQPKARPPRKQNAKVRADKAMAGNGCLMMTLAELAVGVVFARVVARKARNR